MSVHHDLGKVGVAQQEVLADPQKVLFPLPAERNARSDPRMGEEVVAADDAALETGEEAAMLVERISQLWQALVGAKKLSP